MKRSLFRPGLLLGLGALALGAAESASAQDLVVEGGVVVIQSSKRATRQGRLVIRQGKVKAAGAASKVKRPKGVQVLRFPGGYVVPGFVDASAGLGLVGGRDERTSIMAPDVTVSSRIDPKHRDFAHARAAGITTCLVTPGWANLLGGRAALVKTTGALVALKRPILKLALGSYVLQRNRVPTSRAGVLALLRETLRKHHGKRDGGVLSAFARGELRAVVSLGGASDLRALLGLSDRYGLPLVLAPTFKVGKRALASLAAAGQSLSGRTVLLGPWTGAQRRDTFKTAALLSKAGARVAFVSESPDVPASGLRQTVALAIQGGLSPRKALAGITETPAAALGIEHRVGSLLPGRDADFVVFDGPPLRLSSRVLAVYVGGRRVYARPAPKAKD